MMAHHGYTTDEAADRACSLPLWRMRPRTGNELYHIYLYFAPLLNGACYAILAHSRILPGGTHDDL